VKDKSEIGEKENEIGDGTNLANVRGSESHCWWEDEERELRDGPTLYGWQKEWRNDVTRLG
jgi:hypothetical protein